MLSIICDCFSAAWEGVDDFSSGISTSDWLIYNSSQGQMAVQETNGHVSFMVPISTTNEQNAYIIWRGTPTAAEDWMVDITGHSSAPYSTQGSSQLQLAVIDTASMSSKLEGYQISARRDDDSSFGTAQWLGTETISRSFVSTTNVDFSLRLVYHSAGQNIEAWYDPTGSGLGWTMLDAISLANFSPSMTASNTFTFAILGNTYYGPISEGDIWADDFRLAGRPPQLQIADARSLSAFQLILTWTNNGTMWTNNGTPCVLESATALTGNWSVLSTPWIVTNTLVSAVVASPSSPQFYRLRANW